MVRNKSVSLFGSLNLDHFIWSFGEAVSAEYCLLFFRAVSGFRRWFAVGALIQMLTCQYTQEQSFFGWKDYQRFSFQSNPEVRRWYKQHAVLSIRDCPGKCAVFYGQPGGRRYIVQWFFYLLFDLWLKVSYIMTHLPMLTTFYKIMLLLNGWMPLSSHFPSGFCR